MITIDGDVTKPDYVFGSMIPRYFVGEVDALNCLQIEMERHGGLLGYYKRQKRYRMIWDLMK